MGDINCSGVKLFNNITDSCQNFNLSCHVQRGCWFIKYDQIWSARHRHSGHRTLQLPTRHLVRIAKPNVVWVWQTQATVQLNSIQFAIGLQLQPMLSGRFGVLVHQSVSWIKASSSRLRHICDSFSKHAALYCSRSCNQINPSKLNQSARDPTAISGKPHSGQPNCRFTSPRFANQPKYFTFFQIKIYPVYNRVPDFI